MCQFFFVKQPTRKSNKNNANWKKNFTFTTILYKIKEDSYWKEHFFIDQFQSSIFFLLHKLPNYKIVGQFHITLPVAEVIAVIYDNNILEIWSAKQKKFSGKWLATANAILTHKNLLFIEQDWNTNLIFRWQRRFVESL